MAWRVLSHFKEIKIVSFFWLGTSCHILKLVSLFVLVRPVTLQMPSFNFSSRRNATFQGQNIVIEHDLFVKNLDCLFCVSNSPCSISSIHFQITLTSECLLRQHNNDWEVSNFEDIGRKNIQTASK